MAKVIEYQIMTRPCNEHDPNAWRPKGKVITDKSLIEMITPDSYESGQFWRTEGEPNGDFEFKIMQRTVIVGDWVSHHG